jgi:methylglutaconyl-CoA hydratase
LEVTGVQTCALPISEKLASYNPDALIEMNKVLWKGTSHWETLLNERAAISGQLVLSTFTKNALAKFKK